MSDIINVMDQTKRKRPFSRAIYVIVLPIIFIGGIYFGQNVDINFIGNNANVSVKGQKSLDYSSVDEAYNTLISSYDGQLDESKLIDGLKKGLTEATEDPYTEYFSAEESKAFDEQISGAFVGIGAELGKEDNAVVIVAPLKGYPAEKAGVKAKDIILKINDEDALSLGISDAVKKIRGEKGTSVKLNVLRGGTEQLEFNIVREEIKIPSVEYEVLDGSVGYIRISRFSDDTNDLVEEAAKDFKAKGVTSLLVDLRNDPGGYLEQAIQVASHWVDSGKTVVSEKRSGKVIQTHKAVNGQEFKGMKTIVLVNEGSASASEILAGALKDYGLATLVGEKTYGKGSVQQVNKLSGETSIKVTIARWFTPNDKNIDKEGIEPDEKVEITPEQFKVGEDPQKARALELAK